MERYQIDGLAIFRYIEPRFLNVSDEDIVRLYGMWCDDMYCVDWHHVTQKIATDFCKWAFQTPVEQYCNKISDCNNIYNVGDLIQIFNGKIYVVTSVKGNGSFEIKECR